MIQASRSSLLLRLGAGLLFAMILTGWLAPGTYATLFSAGQFMPHRHCYLDDPGMVWLQGLSDFLIGIAYMTISAALIYLVVKARRDIPFHWIFGAFGLFIFSCGWTHFLEVWTLWYASYWLSGAVKALTAVASLSVAAGAFLLVPRVFRLIEDGKELARRRKAQFDKIYARTPVGLCYLDRDLRYVTVNAALADVSGQTVEAHLGRTVRDMDPDLARDIEPAARRVMETNQPLTGIELSGMTAKEPGVEHSWMVNLYPVGENAQDGVDAVVVDVTDRKRAERALEEEAVRRRILFEESKDGIVVMDADGKVTEANRAFAAMLGYPREELLNLHVWEWNGQLTKDEVLQMLRKLPSESITFETKHRRRDGTKFDVECSASGARWQGKTLIYSVERDITERKRLEAQFIQAQKMEVVGQLAGGVAHDFNNILGATLLQIWLMRQTPGLPPDIADGLLELEVENKRAANLTRQLLLFSRRETPQFQMVKLNPVLDGIVKMLKRLLGENVELVLEPSALPLAISADPGMIEQVVTNLCVNARDALPRGGRVLLTNELVSVTEEDCRRCSEAREGSFARLTVTDNGTGMDATVRQHLFEPFFTTKDPGKGTGLGLSTVYGIVKQHKGWLEVQSTVGVGTTFHVYFPLAEQSRAADWVETPEARLDRGTETLLLVEDEQRLRRQVGTALRLAGFEVLEASSGAEAILVREAHGSRIKLLLTDMLMPGGLTGLDLADRLRVLQPDLRVIISSGYTNDQIGTAAQSRSDLAFLPKPYSVEVLLRMIRKCLDTPPQNRALGIDVS